jgi:hypothetical protein
MGMTINSSISAAIGEYLTLGELLKRGVEAYLAHGETQKGWDIVIVSDTTHARVQVKTIDWPTKNAVNGNLTEGFDFLVVVLLDRGKPRSRFFVFSLADIEPLLSTENIARTDGKRTLTMSGTAINSNLKKYEDNWDAVVYSSVSAV